MGNPEAAAEAHGQVNHVGDAGRGLEGDEEREAMPMQTKGMAPTMVRPTMRSVFGEAERDVAAGDADDGEQGDDEDAEEDGGAALGQDVREWAAWGWRA